MGDGPVAVVIPAAIWLKEDLERRAPGRTLIFYDPRGRGRSEWPMDGSHMGLDHDLKDLETIRTHLGLQKISIIGWSTMAFEAFCCTVEHLENMDRLIMIGSGPIHLGSTAPAYRRRRGGASSLPGPSGPDRLGGRVWTSASSGLAWTPSASV